MNIFKFENFISILNYHFDLKTKRNPNYSLRAYSRDLGITNSLLNDVLKKRSGLSRATALKISSKLRFSALETDYFVNLVCSQHGRSARERTVSQKKYLQMKKHFEFFTPIEFNKIILATDWRLLAALECFRLHEFDKTPAWIGNKLGFSQEELDEVLGVLTNVGLVKFDENQIHLLENKNFKWPDDVPSAAGRQMHLDNLNDAAKMLNKVPLEQREYLSVLFALNTDRLAEFKLRCREFIVDTVASANTDPNRDAIYRIGFQLFPHI